MKQLMVLGLAFVVTQSFMCSKPADDQMMRQAAETNTIIDMRQFPGRTIFLINSQSGSWRFDSDSLKYYEVNIPAEDCVINWRLLVTTDKSSKAILRYGNSSVNMNYENNNSTVQKGWRISGTYLFTKEPK